MSEAMMNTSLIPHGAIADQTPKHPPSKIALPFSLPMPKVVSSTIAQMFCPALARHPRGYAARRLLGRRAIIMRKAWLPVR
jgi:hypothetical protein